MPQKDMLTVEQVAEELQISVNTVRRWIRNKQLRAVDLGKEYRVRRRDLEEFIRRRLTIQDEEEVE